MAALKNLPHPLTIIMGIILLTAVATWLVPAGKFDTLSYADKAFILHTSNADKPVPFTQKTLDSLRIAISLQAFEQGDIRKPVAVPDTYHKLPANRQGFMDIAKAPIKGLYDTIDIILLVLLIGGFITVFNTTGVLEKGLMQLSVSMRGHEGWLIIVLTFLLMLGGASYGMAEEAIAFYPILVPLFLAAGYDLLIPVAVIFGGTQLGTLSSFSNPFSTIIASTACGINWTDGFNGRLLMFVLSAILYIAFILRYAQKVRRNPAVSLVHRYHGAVQSPFPVFNTGENRSKLTAKDTLLLILFFMAFVVMITGVVILKWWMLEMSVVFLVGSLTIALLQRMDQKVFVETFISGAKDLLGVAFIIGAARGITIILDNGNISDSVIFYSSQLIKGLPSGIFVIVLLLLFCLFTLFISSSSGMAVITMPIIGALALAVHVPGREVVNSYLYGMGIMGFITPSGLILPSLALVGVGLKTWWKFIWPFMVIMLVVCATFLIVGVNMG